MVQKDVSEKVDVCNTDPLEPLKKSKSFLQKGPKGNSVESIGRCLRWKKGPLNLKITNFNLK